MKKLLSEFAVGERGKILSVDGEKRIRRRLFDMGVTPGTDVLLRKKAPLGDPIEIAIRGYELTLRNAEAACIMMETGGRR
ncbi:MAG: ferrous iron transport protein A [Clostridiales bacterium]|nr:ferrous iron transport protein A [Clostridiales bacterium]MBO5335462.1 ferrous iron transport protein A [Clostridia bacterium]MBQ8352378.1 ferrous iron transport protein A [Clostridia bacterium]